MELNGELHLSTLRSSETLGHSVERGWGVDQRCNHNHLSSRFAFHAHHLTRFVFDIVHRRVLDLKDESEAVRR